MKPRYARAACGVLLAVTMLASASGCRRAGDDAVAGAGDSTPAHAPSELTIAIAGMVTPGEGLEYYKDLSEYVGRKVGLPVRLYHKASYSEVNDMLHDGKVDVAFVCSGPYVEGHDDFGLRLIAAPKVKGVAAYYSYLIVGKDSTATSMADLKGGIFAFTDPKSNTGRMVPLFTLAQMGTTPEEHFGKSFFTYSHDNSIRAVAEGRADGASVDSLVWDYLDATEPKDTSRTRIVSRSEPYATPPVVARPDLDEATVRRVRQAFLGVADDAEGKAILEKMRIDSFVAVEDPAYDSIREMERWVEQHR